MSKKFKFALQPVLEHRKRIEDEKQQVVAIRSRAFEEAKAELERLHEEFRACAGALHELHRRLGSEDLRLHYAHLQFLDRTIEAQGRLVDERREALDRARGDLVEASKERKVVDKLKERRRVAFVAEEMRMEQKELDDGNARRHARAHKSGEAS
ncbi:MAG TPA: flagellar export protein FliJ [Candidatus Acidoferrales bacterium]|nr:flagellar export protein FliJ [Candidatus Acidoferrales bacterium]